MAIVLASMAASVNNARTSLLEDDVKPACKDTTVIQPMVADASLANVMDMQTLVMHKKEIASAQQKESRETSANCVNRITVTSATHSKEPAITVF